MSDVNTNGYVLVKDKDGQLKYYKDGQFFSLEQIKELEKAKVREKEVVRRQIKLEPVYSFEESVKAMKRAPTNIVEKIDLEFEKLEANEQLDSHRNADQQLIESKVKYIIDKLKIQFGDEQIKRRFINVLTTYFRGVRTKKEIEYVLALPRVSGGLELTQDKIGLIMPILDHQVEEIQRSRKDIASKVNVNHEVTPVIADFEHRLEPPPPSTILYQPKLNAKTKGTVAPLAPPKSSPNLAFPQPNPVKMAPISPPVQAKPKIVDVARSQGNTLIGPVEELAAMTIEDFRLLGRNNAERMDELLEKVQLLADQSLVKKIQGISAWRKSPVFQMYLSLCFEGVKEKRSVEQVIERHQRDNEETMTLSEYEGINQLNRMIVI